ncbi:ribonuclease P protein component [Dactylosporangium sp. CA-092794]|uniref:ribonuclease P protein component n=1 Tax=Dactylosporangium sp. CA-092794 TaxID=3239929 RepID=UPI003D8F7083
MLAAAQRLRRREDFAATIRNGRRAGRGALVVHFLNPGSLRPGVTSYSPASGPSGASAVSGRDVPFDGGSLDSGGLVGSAGPVSVTGTTARAGFVVSKAVGNAVVRNTVKRRLRHLVRARIADLPAGSTLVVRALPEAAQARYDALEKDLDAALDAARRPKSRGGRR